MKRVFYSQFLLLAALFLLAGCGSKQQPHIDLRLRAEVDGQNKEAFMLRYRDPHASIQASQNALALLRDSLPGYTDGRLRACNNMAFACYMLADYQSAACWVDSVFALADSAASSAARNGEVERVIAQLMQIRLLQRRCQIAESYLLLYNIDQSQVLAGDQDNYLYSYALMEYYITSLTLNYHYRNSAVASSSATDLTPAAKASLRTLIDEVAAALPSFRCDYAEVMSVNYAVAHSYYRLAAASKSDPALLAKSYHYLADNLRILAIPGQFCEYHLANVFQLQAFIVADTNIVRETCLQHCVAELHLIDSLTARVYPIDSVLGTADYGLELFRLSSDLFFRTADPYQHLGAVVSAAEYCLQQGFTDEAHRYYALALADTAWHDGMAPKFESMLYDGLIRSAFSPSPADNVRWYARQMELLEYIRENESEDALLQNRLAQAEDRNRHYAAAITVASAFLVVLLVLVVLLRRRSKVLRQEKRALQEAKRRDVERIAAVETCLSVLRHDVSPFLSYLQNKNLSSTMRDEVVGQLVRTFSNIKGWTTLTLPAGVRFSRSSFPIAPVFETVAGTCANIRGESVALLVDSVALCLWGDCQLVEIMLRNLVSNALRHTAEGSVRLSAAADPEDSRFAILSVADTGCGMDAETLDNLFRSDKQIRPADPADPGAGGSGFGLILCRYIVKCHDDNTLRGCRIWAESHPGRGSTFYVRLARNEELRVKN